MILQQTEKGREQLLRHSQQQQEKVNGAGQEGGYMYQRIGALVAVQVLGMGDGRYVVWGR
jgi:hypothetical protein